jgi:hypothetical protein
MFLIKRTDEFNDWLNGICDGMTITTLTMEQMQIPLRRVPGQKLFGFAPPPLTKGGYNQRLGCRLLTA